MRYLYAVVLGTLALTAGRAGATPAEDAIDARLQLFGQDPARAMALHMQKTDEQGRVITRRESVFSDQDIASRDYVLKKAQSRTELCRSPSGESLCTDEAAILGNDLASNLVDDPATLVTSLAAMDQKHLQHGTVKVAPWSDTYWPYYSGTTGMRYADSSFPNSTDWQENNTYIQQNTAASIVQAGDAATIDTLSPAEKYDRLVGDTNFTLTQSNWGFGKSYFDTNGTVESWMGICDGWASAAIAQNRPGKLIQVTAADGQTKINFYPSDIKALASLLWSTGYKSLKFISGRCDLKNPPTDANGRILDQNCFDTNPGTWHEVIVNQIGRTKRSFIMDAQYDYEVWNQPLLSYSYTYFNPQTLRRARTLADATVNRGDFTNDKFKSYRSPKTKTFVGIAMQAVYVQETTPNHNTIDSVRNDSRRAVTYLYDIELDANGRIIGGEWYQNEHPDFLWGSVKGSQVTSSADGQAQGSWQSGDGVPASWSKPAARASAKGQPLGKVVRQLIKMSSGS